MIKNIIFLTSFLFLCFVSKTKSQIYIPSGSNYSVFSTMNVLGDVVNNGNMYMAPNASLYFSGISQSVSGSNPVNLTKVYVNSMDTLKLRVGMKISDSLIFLRGKVFVDPAFSGAEVHFDTNASHRGANQLKYIDGWVKKTGLSEFTFPVGKDSLQRLSISSSPSLNIYRTKYYRGLPPKFSRIETCIDHVSTKEYWELNRISGAADVKVTLEWDASSGGIINPSQMLVARLDSVRPTDPTWRSEGNGATTGGPVAGNVTSGVNCAGSGSGNIPSYGFFTMASFTSINPLPITLLEFFAKVEGDYVRLDWTTLTELHNDHFTIERSTDLKNWKKVFDKKTKDGNSKVKQSYYGYDYTPYIGGVSYYRLSQTDVSGDMKRHGIRSVYLINGVSLDVYPNPTTKHVIVKSGQVDDKNSVILIDVIGRVIRVPSLKESDGKYRYDLSDLADGTYFLKIKTRNNIVTRKIVKQ